MKDWIAGHRAVLGLLGLAAWVGLFVSLDFPGTPGWLATFLLVAALLGLAALVGSPYWKIVYREAPLRSAAGEQTDLDEREHALRDRAHGLAYFLFATVNILMLSLAWTLVHLHELSLDADKLQAALFPYATFAVTLPVILIEWFQPSGPAPAEIDDEE